LLPSFPEKCPVSNQVFVGLSAVLLESPFGILITAIQTLLKLSPDLFKKPLRIV
jgi:hypothetical protein